MRTYYIYKATNKVNGKSYIGQTVDYRRRLWQHRRCYEKEDCKFHDAIKEFGFDNFECEIIETCTSKNEADKLERKYIELYDSYRSGYNDNKGGVGGHNARPIVCLDFSGNFIKRYDSAADAEEDGYNNVNVLLCCKNKLRSCKNRMFMFEDEYKTNGPKEYNPYIKEGRKVVQCDMNGKLIARFNSVKEAAEKTGANRTTISNVLLNKKKSAAGFIFVYEENFPIKDLSMYEKRKKGRRIAQIDAESGNIINVYERIADAGKALGVNYKCIHKVVDIPERTAYGYKWISQ